MTAISSRFAPRLRPVKLILLFLTLILCALLVTASIINYTAGDVGADFRRSPVPEIGNALYETGMGYATSVKSDVFTRDVLYALEKGDGNYSQLANSHMQKILALKNDSLSEEEIIFVESIFFVCKAEYAARKTEYLAGLFLTGFLHKEAAKTDRTNSDKIFDMLLGAKTMTDIRRIHDFGRQFLELTTIE